jgi:hypothetical protein
MESPQDRHTLGGVFSIISGSIGILGALTIVLLIVFMGFIINMDNSDYDSTPTDDNILIVMLVIYGLMALFYIALGVLGIVGGIFCLKKKHWGVALAGAIAGAMTLFPCGIAAVIFVAMAKPEFSVPKPPELPLVQPEIERTLSG